MTGQKIDHGEQRRELEVVDRCEYKRYSLSTPAYSLSHDGERQAPAEADVSLGKENEFWITNGDRFPGLLWSPARARAGDQQAETPRKTGLHSSFKQLSAHKGVCLQLIQPSLCPAPGTLSFGPQESCLPFSSHPKRWVGVWKWVSVKRDCTLVSAEDLFLPDGLVEKIAFLGYF